MALDWLDDEELPGDNYFPKKEKEIDIPDFLNKGPELPTEEQLMAQAMLNNVPNNNEIEKQNHLAELERACQNWDEDEWHAVIIHAASRVMTAELDRRLKVMESYIQNTRSNMNLLTSQKI
ncbi:MAG: hypothetical protein MJ236_05400 [Clostridia bacterium]|nr:hypothetical protein [Clostridia bacterium]